MPTPDPGLLGRLFASARVTETAGGVVVQSAPGRYVAWLIAFVLVVAVAGYLWRRGIGGPFVKGAFIAAFTIPALVVPGMAGEFVRVGPERLEVSTGLWFKPGVRSVDLHSLRKVVRVEKAIAQRGLPRRDTFWELRYQDGHGEVLHLSDLFEANQYPIAAALRRRGIEVR